MNPVIEKLTGLGIIDESDPHEHALFISNRRITERFGPDNQQEQSTYEQVIADVFGIEYHAAFRKEAEMMLKYMLSETVRQYVEGAYVDVAQVVDVAKGMLDRYMIRFPWVVPGWKSVGGYITPADGERVADGSTKLVSCRPALMLPFSWIRSLVLRHLRVLKRQVPRRYTMPILACPPRSTLLCSLLN